ncbi:hypothetical protein BC941DRAFT_426264, partial [Chlamydoabsidia padenii]
MLASVTEQSCNTERFVLPPISTLDEYIPKPPYKNDGNSNNLTMLSPPSHFSSSTASPPSLSSNHSTTLIQHPLSPPRTSFEKMDALIYPIRPSTGTPIRNNSILRTVSSDVDQVVQQANSLCDNMVHYKPYLLSSTSHDELRPWMDDMIGKANEVLNALLRLRKQQMVSPSHNRSSSSTDQLTLGYYPQYHASSSPSSSTHSLPSPPSTSSKITITKRDWPNSTAQQQYHDSFGMTNNRTSIPSRQRKRGKQSNFQGRCHSCNISETPEWRRGPDGARTLCNACGLR